MSKHKMIASLFASLLVFSFLTAVSCSDSSSSGTSVKPSLYIESEDDSSTEDETS